MTRAPGGPGPGRDDDLIAERRVGGSLTVKDRVGRTRYVAFRVAQGAPVSRAALSGALPATARLTRFDGTFGILRTTHRDRDALLAVLKEPRSLGGKEVRFETLTTSGTLRKAAEGLPSGSPASKRTPAPGRGP